MNHRYRFAPVALLFASALDGGPGAAAIPFPAEYRRWLHVKSAMITAAHPAAAAEGGLHHIYANPQAAEGYRSGNFADGSVLVYELLEAREKDGVIAEGPRRRLDVMVKDSARFPSSAGWGYERFRGSSETPVLSATERAACSTCHQRAAAHGHVFSTVR